MQASSPGPAQHPQRGVSSRHHLRLVAAAAATTGVAALLATGSPAAARGPNSKAGALAQARAIVAAAERGYVTSKTPTGSLFAVKTFPGPVTSPPTSKMPHNKKVVFIAAGVDLQYAEALQQRLVAPLGWHISYVQTAGTPSAYAQAFQQAISERPAAIELAGLPDATVGAQIAAARKAGIKMVSTAGPQLVHPGFDSYLSVRFDVLDRIAANLAISSSGGSAHVLFVVPSGYTEVDMNIPAFGKALSACKGCSSTTIEYSIPDFVNPVTLQANITSQLNANPKINYVVDAFDQAPSAPISNAIKASGRAIKLILVNGSLTGLQAVAQGSAIGDVSTASNWIEYAEADDLRRVLSGHAALPFNAWVGGGYLFTKANLPTTITLSSVATKLNSVGPYVAAYKRLWATGKS